jgi:hypothetical protein
LSADAFPHATVAQQHGGILGFFQKKILTLNGSLMFNRAEKKDRSLVAKKMKQHVADVTKAPLLIFPEGTCVNNEYTVLFHKGAFDLGVMVAPVAIKYDKKKADAYWHSKTQSFTRHLIYLMTRWSLVADVFYLPPRYKRVDQSASEFADEVKAEISKTAGLKNLSWDGYWKNFVPTKEKQESLREIPRERYSAVVLRRSRMSVPQKLGRRMSFADSSQIQDQEQYEVDWNQEIEWDESQASIQTSIRNQVLKSLQQQERQESLVSVITSKRKDVTDTWKLLTRQKDGHTQRLENMSWRLWHKQRVHGLRKDEQEAPNVIVEFVSKLTRVPSRIYSPNDLYHVDGISLDNGSESPKRLWDFTDDETLFD